MLIRIVKMQFKEGTIDQFETIFGSSHPRIRAFDGCMHLSLIRDIDNPNVFFTISHWTSEKALETYRQSELFRSTWNKTKPLFEKRAEAWSTSIHTSI